MISVAVFVLAGSAFWAASFARTSHLQDDIRVLRWEVEVLRGKVEAQHARIVAAYALINAKEDKNEDEAAGTRP